jgi:Fe-S cluster biogenesis protein NfuA/nitrite reductase/ring-hydroxylating ferredoxin subunit
MYDLAPVHTRIQVEEALDEVRPYIESHGGEVTLLEVQDGVVHLELSGACHGCAGSAMTLRRGIEAKLRERYPEFREVVAHDPSRTEQGNGGAGHLLQIEASPLIQVEGLKRPVFESVGPLDELSEGKLLASDVGGIPVLVVKLEGEPYAFKNRCPFEPERSLALDGGRLTGTVLVCPWHNCAYDARTGHRVDDRPDEPGLTVVPVAISDGVLKIAVNVT